MNKIQEMKQSVAMENSCFEDLSNAESVNGLKRTIKMLPEEERPIEKCVQMGPTSLTNTELLAVILRTGCRGCNTLQLADRILHASPVADGLSGIFHLSIKDLCAIEGIGPVKASQVLCIGELSKRIAQTRSRRLMIFDNPETIADYYMERLRHEEQEQVICMMLDTKSALIGEVDVSKGTVNASLISPRELFLKALGYHAVHIILVHNHPSGDPNPSPEDLLITRRVVEAGQMIGITLLDHIIIGDRSYVSLCRTGELGNGSH